MDSVLAEAVRCLALGDPEGAIEGYRHRVPTASGALAYAGLGSALLAEELGAAALDVFEAGLARYPDERVLAEGRAVSLERLKRTPEAIAAYEGIVAIAPASHLAWNNLGGLLNRQGRNEEAIVAFTRALDLQPGNPVYRSNVLLAQNYSDALDNATQFARHREWAAGVDAPAAAAHDNVRDPLRRLRIGYLSADFRTHPVAFFIGAVLAAHDREAFEVYCYSACTDPDALTDTLRRLPLSWRDVSKLDDVACAALIRRDCIDVLIELGGHTAGNRLLVMAHRPAPVQVSYLGYPNTSGLAAIDWRLTDAVADPPGLTDAWHTEGLVRLGGGFLAYTPPSNMPSVGPLPTSTAGGVTFGSFSNLAKVSSTTLGLWSAVLAAVPASRLLLKAREFADAGTREAFLARFVARGVEPARLELLAEPTEARAHFGVWNRIDVALDTYPYNGTTTSCEALWMGVPLVTLAGDRHAARVGASLLTAAGLPRLVAKSAAEYVAIAGALAAGPEALAKTRATLRDRLCRSPLLDAKRLTREIEQAVREKWGDWCGRGGQE